MFRSSASLDSALEAIGELGPRVVKQLGFLARCRALVGERYSQLGELALLAAAEEKSHKTSACERSDDEPDDFHGLLREANGE